MKLIRHLFFIVAMFATTETFAQYQTLFTQYNMSPMTLNPAMTGAYEGSYRVGGIYRTQWNVGNSTYDTPSFFVDAPLLMIKKRHWVGLGASIVNDVAGSLNLGQTHTSLAGAFHYALDKKYKNVLTFGLQGTLAKRSFDPVRAAESTYTALANGAADASFVPSITQDGKASYVDLNVGALLKSKIDKKSDIAVGFAVGHLTNPKYGLFKGAAATKPTAKLPVLITLHADYNRMLNKKLSIHPSLLFRKITESEEFNLNAMVGYRLDKNRPDMVLKAGLGSRLTSDGKSINALLGVDYQNIRFGLAYDIATGKTAQAVDGTLELAIHYTGKIYKKPDVKGVHFCPKY